MKNDWIKAYDTFPYYCKYLAVCMIMMAGNTVIPIYIMQGPQAAYLT